MPSSDIVFALAALLTAGWLLSPILRALGLLPELRELPRPAGRAGERTP